MAAQEEDHPLTSEFSGLVVNDDLGYPVTIGSGLRSQIRKFLRARGSPVLALSDDAADIRHFASSIVPPDVKRMLVRLGERQKRLATVEQVLNGMLEAGTER